MKDNAAKKEDARRGNIWREDGKGKTMKERKKELLYEDYDNNDGNGEDDHGNEY